MLVPRPCIAAMAATAIRAAIRPYSMAVAALLLRMNLRMVCIVRFLDLYFSRGRSSGQPRAPLRADPFSAIWLYNRLKRSAFFGRGSAVHAGGGVIEGRAHGGAQALHRGNCRNRDQRR